MRLSLFSLRFSLLLPLASYAWFSHRPPPLLIEHTFPHTLTHYTQIITATDCCQQEQDGKDSQHEQQQQEQDDQAQQERQQPHPHQALH